MPSKDLENKARNRAFQNPVLELLTLSNPPLILGTYLPIIIGLFWYGHAHGYMSSFGAEIGLFVFAFFSWTLFEYLAHRYIFHYLEGKPQYHRAYQLLHGLHHDHPKDPQRLFMPPVVGIIMCIALFGLFYLFIRNYTFFFLPGFVFGYLTYVMTHYAMHRFNPPFKFLEPLWKHHHLHHFRYPELAFGVSNFFWDKVFGTMPPKPGQKMSKAQEKATAA